MSEASPVFESYFSKPLTLLERLVLPFIKTQWLKTHDGKIGAKHWRGTIYIVHFTTPSAQP